MKKYLFGLFAVVLAIGFSAFTMENAKKVNRTDKRLTLYYFDYSPTSYADSDFQTSGNWTDGRTSAGGDPCTGLNNNPCTVIKELADGLTGAQAKTAFINYLNTPGIDASDYCTNNSNIAHKKP